MPKTPKAAKKTTTPKAEQKNAGSLFPMTAADRAKMTKQVLSLELEYEHLQTEADIRTRQRKEITLKMAKVRQKIVHKVNALEAQD